MEFFTSDLHLMHDKPFLYEPRGFKNQIEHAETIVSNINEIVLPEDELFILGDLVLVDTEKGIEYLKQIQCKNVHFIAGNHDSVRRVELYCHELGYDYLGEACSYRYNKKNFMLSHYPMRTMNFDDNSKPWERTINICGHSHTKDIWDMYTNSYHVELDAHNNYPVSIEKIISDYINKCKI